MALADELAAAVFRNRRDRKWSRLKLAEEAGVGKTVIWDIEHAKPTVRLATLNAVLSALDLRLVLQDPGCGSVDAAAPGGEVESEASEAPGGSPFVDELPDHLL